MKYKCHTCHTIFDKEQAVLKDGKDICPICGEPHLVEMCPLDHLCTCAHEVTYGIHYCKECGKPICPCGSHDVECISRVTGYLQALGGFNAAKQQEVKDRHKYSI